MKLTCTICGEEFEGRTDAKFCSDTCRKRASRVTDNIENVTDNGISVTKPEISVTSKPSDVTNNAGLDKLDYYHSKEYLDLVKHLEETPIKELEKEGTFIPCWKHAGYLKKPNVGELLK